MQVLHKRTETAFGSWLYDRYAESGQTMLDMTDAIGISKECFLCHVRGDNCPTIPTLFLYARYFDEDIYTLVDLVCIDLNNDLDRHNESAVYYMQRHLQSPFSRWLTDEICAKRLSVDDVAGFVGLQSRTIMRHIASYSKPNFDMIKRYANTFGENVGDVYELTLRNT